MEINADFSQRVLVHSDDLPWQPSPMPGVERRMLDRIGGEVARATSLVRYAPGSQFSAHTHTGGEEFLVLEGTFQDEHGDYPAGTYVRNPPTTSHVPGSQSGCTILVKLWQFDLDDRHQMRIDTTQAPVSIDGGDAALLLHHDQRERVTFETWAPHTHLARDLPDGAELFLIEGHVVEKGESMRPGSWLRLPTQSVLDAKAGSQGAKLWMKAGHIPYASTPAAL